MNYRLYMDTQKSIEYTHEVNEDHYMFTEFSFMKDHPIRLLVIADGMGGLSNGSKASQIAITRFVSSFYTQGMLKYTSSTMDEFSLKYNVTEVESMMREAIGDANNAVCQAATSFEEMGTTLSAVCVVGDCIVAANVGDSPIYYFRRKSNAVNLITTLDTKAEADVKFGRYERYSSEYFANTNKLCSYLGQYMNINQEDIHIHSVGGIDDGDVIIMGSDGCFGDMREHILLGLLETCSREEEGFVLNQIFDMAKLDCDDDQTAIMYVVGEKE